MKTRLSDHEDVLLAANVRARPFPGDAAVGDGRGREGDLLLGTVFPGPPGVVEILDGAHTLHRATRPQHVVAVLGSRDSSTHVCAIVPDEGIDIHDGLELSWVGGPSGIIGQLVRENEADSSLSPERSARFRCTGLVHDAAGRFLNVTDFAVSPRSQRFDLPMALIGATSSEAGKTVLCGKLIRNLAQRGLRLGAIKATGTGGGLDGLHYRENGAVAVLDQVDAGLLTTHGDADGFKQRIVRVFRQMVDLDVDAVLVELGGDLVSANNPAFFEIDELVGHARIMAVIANDALAAHGVATLAAQRLRYPAERIRYVTSPFRNHDGMRRRFAAVGIPDPHDPNAVEDLAAVVATALGALVRTDRPGISGVAT